MPWRVKTYKTQSDKEVVRDFILGLQPATKAKVTRLLDLLEEFGPNLGMPHARSMGDGLYELRIRSRQESRIFYVFAAEYTIYLLHGFVKKSQETPNKELLIARKRQYEISGK